MITDIMTNIPCSLSRVCAHITNICELASHTDLAYSEWAENRTTS